MNIVPASQNSFTAAIRLLESCGLPTRDITPGTQLFVIEEGNNVLGTVAVEYNYDTALLRSLSVTPEHRNQGIAGQLVEFIENYVRQQGVRSIYILTETAEQFFSKSGYQSVTRDQVPEFIQNTSEFSAICPSSAAMMKKDL